ncbi:putative FIP1[V]-like protein [Cocos nucifera]|uniref:Putative FIP1[V]-like protein n=1 Tax=Cocos nucifera TaxID=13894 RepID=A0A8K0I6X1_COCNU|nr:putative FIP1[V]-like protein [Cocos nucifera]
MPSPGGAASCSLSIPASAQNGYSFTLPRNRTIFDINIEAFEQKPWKQPGVDITDYFNFSLDEDGWKSYCQQLDQFRQRVTMFTQFPDYNLSRRNQVLESDLGSPKAMLSEAAQWEHREKSFLHMENVERRLMGLQMPKGRAIQVESGVSERIPSADIRRPRRLDSDVVIQPKGRAIQVESGVSERIPSADIRRPRRLESDVVIQIAMDGSKENVSIPCEGELKHAEQGHEDCLMLEYENEPNEGMLSRDFDGQGYWEITDPIVHCYPEVAETGLKGAADKVKDKLDYPKGESEDLLRLDDSLMEAEISSGAGVQVMAESNLKGAGGEVKDKLDYSKGESENSLRVDDSPMEAEFASGVGVQVMQSLSSSDLDSHSEASKDDGCLNKIHAAIRKTSLDSLTGMQESVRSDCDLSNDSGINATKKEMEDIKGNTFDCRLSPEVYKGCSTSGHNVMSELNLPAENEQASIRSPRKSQNDVDPFEVSYGIKESKHDHRTDIRGHLSANKETKMSVSYKSRKYAEKHASEKSSAKSSHKKGDHDNHPRINQNKRDCFEQRASGRDSALKHRERYSREWHRDTRGERVVCHEHCDESISECGSIFLGKDSSTRHKKERENEHLIQTGAVNHEHRYREKHVQEMHRRHIAKCDGDNGIFDHSFRRAAPCSGREDRTPEKRDKYDRSSCFDLYGSNKYIEYDAERLRHLDGRPLDSQMYEHHFEDERGRHDTTLLRNHLHRSCRSHEKFLDHRKHFAIREIVSRYEKYEYCFAPSSKDCHHSSYENDSKFHDDEHITEERGTYVDDIVREKSYGRLAKPRPDADDKVSFEHGDPNLTSQEESFLCERSSRNEKSFVKQHLFSGRKFSDDCRLSNVQKELVNERTRRSSSSDAWEHGKFVLHNFDEGRHEPATLGRREAVNMHLNGLKRKFHKRANEVTVASEIHRVVIETIDEEQKDSRHIEEVHLLEVPLHVPKSQGTHNHPTSLKERVRELKSEHSDDNFLRKCEDKHPISQSNVDDEIEEGQLIEESDDQHVGSMTEYWNPKKKVALPAVKASQSVHLEEKNTQAKESTPDNKIFGGYDSNRILETLAKMEKRRERFKEPLALKRGPEKTPEPQLEVATVTDEPKQQRPARKRRAFSSLPFLKTPPSSSKASSPPPVQEHLLCSESDEENEEEDEEEREGDQKTSERFLAVRRPVKEVSEEAVGSSTEAYGKSEGEEKFWSSSKIDEGLKEFAKKIPILEPVRVGVAPKERPLAINLELGLYRAKVLTRNSRFKEAEEILLKRAVQASPKNRFAWHIWALFEASQGDINKGRKLLKIGHAVNPRDPVILQSLALLEYNHSSANVARVWFRRASEIDPRHQPVWVAWGWMEWKEGNINTARELYQRALSIDSTSESAARCLQAWGVLEQRMGNLSVAKRLFRSSLNINSQSYITWMTWASLEEEQGNPIRAEEIRNLYFQQRIEVVDDASWVMGFLDIIDPALDSIKRLLNLDQTSNLKGQEILRTLEETNNRTTEASDTTVVNGNDEGSEDNAGLWARDFDLDAFIRDKLSLDASALDALLENSQPRRIKSSRRIWRS